MELVRDRKCGECTVCCVAPGIDTEEFQTMPGVPCKHLCAGACSIYPTRYIPCQAFYCGWRYLDVLGDEWRPDKCGVMLRFEPKANLPPPYEGELIVWLISQPPGGFGPVLLDFVARVIAADRIRVKLVPLTPPGCVPVETLLNDALRQPALKGDLAPIEAVFSEAMTLASTAPHLFKPYVNRHDTNS